MSERQLTRAVVELATRFGWRVHHTSDSRSLRTHHPGLPDLIMVRDRELMAIELKVKGRKPTEAQQAWLDAIDRCWDVSSDCWTDEDWTNGSIEELLK